MTGPHRRVLAITSGPSSLKAAVGQLDPAEVWVLSMEASRIGLPGSRLQSVDAEGRHGGRRHWAPELVAPDLPVSLARLARIDPEQLPRAIAAIRAVEQACPGVPHVACFDTGFRRGLPAVARGYTLPRDLAEAGAVRYGLHGLSYECVFQELRPIDEPAAVGCVVLAHLVFPAGSSERAAPGRERNRRHGPVIATGRRRLTARGIRTNEELVVARYASRVAPAGGHGV